MATKTAINPLAAKIGERIRAFRLARGMKQDTLADEVGYSSRAAIAQFENGFAVPSLEKVIDLARVLGVHPGALLSDAEIPSQDSEERLKQIRTLRALADDMERTIQPNDSASSQRRSVVPQLVPFPFALPVPLGHVCASL